MVIKKLSGKVLVIILAIGILLLSIALSIPYYLRAIDAARIKHGEDGWEVALPETKGMDNDLIIKADKYISKTDAVSMIIIKDGYIVFEKYYRGQLPHDLCFAFPTANSILSALIGISIEEGQIKSVDQKIVDYFPEQAAANSDPGINEISIKHLLTMTSGFCEPDDELFHTRDWIGNLLKLKINTFPGTRYFYSPRITYLLSGILTKATRMSAYNLSKKYIFDPMKASPGIWHIGPEKMNTGGEYLYLKPADIAKFGYLYINHGKWKDQQILPEKWVEQSLKIHTDLKANENIQVPGELSDSGINDSRDSFRGFGYGFIIRNIGNRTVYTIEDVNSLQSMCIVPELDIVVVVTTYHSIFKSAFNYVHLKTLLKDYIIPAVIE